MPSRLAPMLAVLSEMPCDPQEYSFEFKWDGVRAISFWTGRRLSFQSRNQLDITPRYPELYPLAKALGRRRCILDGEVVALDEHDRPSFARLQRRMHVGDPRAVQRLMGEVPVYYILFDLLYLDGQSLMHHPWTERRELLDALALAGPAWRISPAVRGKGSAILQTARDHGLEGIVAKRMESIYEPGVRSRAWLKVKLVQRQEFVIGGWFAEKGDNRKRVGALLLGYHEMVGGKRLLRYAGSVGTGFTDQTHRQLVEKLNRHRRADSPFAGPIEKRGVPLFVEPVLVADVEYRRWPAGARVQQAAFKGLRTDKAAREVVKEVPQCPKEDS